MSKQKLNEKLLKAVVRGDPQAVIRLLGAGAAANAIIDNVCNEAEIPLLVAAQNGYVDV